MFVKPGLKFNLYRNLLSVFDRINEWSSNLRVVGQPINGNLNGFKNSRLGSLNLKNTIAAGRLISLSGPATPAKKVDHAYLKLTYEAARALAEKRGLKSRIISQEGKTFSVSRKIEQSRVNFIIENNEVIRLIRG